MATTSRQPSWRSTGSTPARTSEDLPEPEAPTTAVNALGADLPGEARDLALAAEEPGGVGKVERAQADEGRPRRRFAHRAGSRISSRTRSSRAARRPSGQGVQALDEHTLDEETLLGCLVAAGQAQDGNAGRDRPDGGEQRLERRAVGLAPGNHHMRPADVGRRRIAREQRPDIVVRQPPGQGERQLVVGVRRRGDQDDRERRPGSGRSWRSRRARSHCDRSVTSSP